MQQEKVKGKPGRLPKPINWDTVKGMIISGMKLCNIAVKFDIHPTNLAKGFQKEFGCEFTEYAAKLRQSQSKCEDILWMQYIQAMKGSTRMLELLGMEECGQGKEKNIIPPNQEQLDKDDKIMRLEHRISQLESNANQP